MKKLMIALTGAVLFAACQKKEVTMNITVKDKTLDSVSVYLSDMDTTLALSAEGTATVTLPVNEAQYGMVQYKWLQSTVYVEPGKNLNVKWDMTPSALTIAFGEGNADKNNFINGKELSGPVMGDFGRTEEDFLNQLAEYEAEDYKIIDGKNFDKTFAEKEKARVKYWVYGILWQYASKGECSPAVYEKLQSLISEDEWLTQLSEYTNFMSGTIDLLANKDQNSAELTPLNRTINNMNYVIKNLKSQKIKDYMLGLYGITYISSMGVNNTETLKALVEENVKDPETLKAFQAAYANGASLAKGNPSPDFKMTDINGKEYTLADFKGKVVYIDVWATWCAPCQGELPHLKELQQMFQGTNVRFISMSIDKDKAAWEKQVKEEKLGGIQLYAGPESQFCTDYKIQGIPHFILIDKEGKIIEANMTRPSNESTIQTISMYAEGE